MSDGSRRLDSPDSGAGQDGPGIGDDPFAAAAPGAHDSAAWWARPAQGTYGDPPAAAVDRQGYGSGYAGAYSDAGSDSAAGYPAPSDAPAFSAAGAHAATYAPPAPTDARPAGGPGAPDPYGAPDPHGAPDPYGAPGTYGSTPDRPWEVPRPWGAPSTDTLGGPASAQPGRRRGRLGIAAAVVAGALAGSVAGGTVVALTEDDQGQLTDSSASLGSGVSASAPVDRAPDSVAGIADKVLRSTVSIAVELPSGNSGSGSGVVLRDDGYVLTNNHVVEAGQASGATISVTVNGSEGREFPAKIVGRDAYTDLAVLKVGGGADLVPATLGRSSDLVVGDPVVAIGSPLGLQGTVTTGIVSSLNREVRISADETLLNAIQTDAAINPGNSGGALVDARGAVVGINSAIATLGGGQSGGSIGVGFAIPVDEARSVAEEIIRTGKATHPAIGVSGEDAEADGQKQGARVREVVDGGPADEAGLRPGDVISKVEDTDVDSVVELIVALRGSKVGDQVTVTYERDDQVRTLDVTLSERESD